METYEVELPNGSVYEVDVPEGAMVDHQAVLEKAIFPNLDEKDRLAVVSSNGATGVYYRNWVSQPRPGETERERNIRLYGQITGDDQPDGMDTVRLLGQGISGGTMDEITALGAASLDRLSGKYPDESFNDIYSNYLSRERAALERARRDAPVTSALTEIGGAVPTLAIPGMGGPRLAEGAGPLTRAAVGSGVGGAQGAAYGFAAGEGGAANRAKSAVVPTALGGGIGALAAPVSSATKNAVDAYLTSRAGKQVGMSGPAMNTMMRTMSADQSLAGRGAQRMAQIGDEAMVADAGPMASSLLDTIIQKSGPAAFQALSAVERRVANASKKIERTLNQVLGQPVGRRETARNISRATSEARDEAYQAAYRRPIDYSSEAGRKIEDVIERTPNRILEDAVRKANEEMQIAGKVNRQILIQVADDGSVSFMRMPNVQQLDFLKRALNEISSGATDDFGRLTGEGNRIASLAKDLRTALGEAVPQYSKAVKLGGDKIERDNALRLGQTLLNPSVTREIVNEGVEDISVEARAALRAGLRSYLDDTIANVRRTVGSGETESREAMQALKMLSSRASRQKIVAALGRKDAVKLFGDLDKAAAAFELQARLAQNSKTFPRQVMDEAIDAQIQGGVINSLRAGRLPSAGREAIATMAGRGSAQRQQITDNVMSEIATALTGPQGGNARQLLEAISAAQQTVGPRADNWRGAAEALMRMNPRLLTGPIIETDRANRQGLLN